MPHSFSVFCLALVPGPVHAMVALGWHVQHVAWHVCGIIKSAKSGDAHPSHVTRTMAMTMAAAAAGAGAGGGALYHVVKGAVDALPGSPAVSQCVVASTLAKPAYITSVSQQAHACTRLVPHLHAVQRKF